MNRVIRKSRAQSASEALDLLGALFTAELLAPSKCIWLVSPWISDIEILDNVAGTYPVLDHYGKRVVRLSEVLGTLAADGARIVVATTLDAHNDAFTRRMGMLSRDLRVEHLVDIRTDPSGRLHTKALTGDGYALAGSMNITYNGVFIREEQIELRTDEEYVVQARMDAYDRFGGVL
ncbi:phospholipase D-like domain-containing protein DpdK [Amycolatopsis nigrescens]|uniref:phospholipase D-like domain-containing protein DpdK n=1 Tax=Amycolatopsis nigrescens TaxID=381445 RepID=UPI000380F3FA|nr:phospholipase D-like domain-containing protein DpdK [Amycolatopsis nigrescens]